MKNKSERSFRFPAFLGLVLLLTVILSTQSAYGAFTAKTDLFSADKDTPLGFTNLVEPNVLLLIDTSGSMAYRMRSSASTYGDGTNPYNFGGSTTYNYFGADENPGNNTAGNNNESVEFNYHPLLRVISDDLVPIGTRGYFSFDIDNTKPQRWDFSMDNINLGTSYRLHPQNGQLQRKEVIFFIIRWEDVGLGGSKPNLPSGYRWEPDGDRGVWYLYKFGPYKRYKYPNDSRMYTLKNVMYRILTDSSLVGNIRLALASYRQTPESSGSGSSYYRWSPTSGGFQQRISWKYPDENRDMAMLRVNFGSTTKLPEGPVHLESIRQWFDGTETASNPEFRADGMTPLASSIWYNSSESVGAYFSAVEDEMDWCQDNWLIVLTDGANTDNYDEEDAVTRLYGMSLTSRNGSPAKKVKTFVIGLIDPDEEDDLADTLNAMAANGQTEKAYFATDMEGLLAAFKKIFQTIQDFAATGSAPLVNPPTSAGSEGKVYSTGFKPKPDQQWTGYLYSYTISDDVLETPHNWEAGVTLTSMDYGDRNIYTADWGGSTASSLSGSNLKNFLSSQVEALRPLLAGTISTDILSNAKLAQFIDWVRGLDVWDETEGDDRWKLGDPYHVGLVEVGAPQSLLKDQAYRNFAETYKNRNKFVYLHANDGMVHSFASETNNNTTPKTTGGVENWAFIPPNVLGYRRLLGLKVDAGGNWVTNEKYSVPKYLLDGPLVAEDVYFGGAYRTVMLGSLGRAGAGMYALDITDPYIPKFLWALENNYYDQATMAVRPVDERTFLRWAASGGSATSVLSTVAASDSSALGRLRLTVSTPFIGTVDINYPSGTDVITKWVSLFGAGAQYAYSDTDTDGGKAVYVIDMENGARIKELTHADLGMAVAPLSIETGPRPLRIKTFYLGDHKGAVFEGDASAASTDNWTLQRVFTPGTVTPSTVTGIPYAVEIGIIKNRKWLFWGTGDPDGLFGTQTGRNYIVALNRNTAGSDTTYSDLESLDRNNVDSVARTLNGWHLRLASTETVTTPPVLYKGYIFIATYAPVADDNCKIGNSHFYILKADTGLGGWIDASGNENKYVTLEATRISGITVSGGKLYVGVTRYPGASNPPAVMGNVTLSGNLMVIDVPDHIKNSEDDIPSKSTRPTYWRDWKP
ncbi:PilC/PilY family type IV pilus protein [Aminivibrio sp.]|uniref:pilus assembly protein n=1 Tax=Aminivibrio sp. TaxID=1872489 RepID=UPI001A5614C9|nr:PilC/PilY family type IV pilus protein [Aminivibrio sp.]MBL3540672.1 hypothetical protein [Aminivibrio sp.]